MLKFVKSRTVGSKCGRIAGLLSSAWRPICAWHGRVCKQGRVGPILWCMNAV